MDVDTPGSSATKPKTNMTKMTEENPKKTKNRTKKRRRESSGSSTDMEDVMPDNTLEVEKNLHALAIKNNLDDVSVKKILKKVVTNDHVLALVKMREEEDSGSEEQGMTPKLTRAKAKKLMKESPKLAPWNLELTPIVQLPINVTPEVKTLIAHDLPDDEDDDEYQPTHDDVHSDDDHTDLSYSDLESQPRTPATPLSQPPSSPALLTDGPFKVPPKDLKTPTRRRLDIDQEATIARRTRSKVCLTSTSIEQLEDSFVPPDEVLPTDVDNVWSEFILDCMNPAPAPHEEDDDDPEYNVAADPDAHDEDEEALENSIIKISKKELNDLVTELFHIMPEDIPTNTGLDDNNTFNSTANTDMNDTANTELNDSRNTELNSSNPRVYTELSNVKNRWEGKREPLSDNETENQGSVPNVEMPRPIGVVSIGKTEPMDLSDVNEEVESGQMLVEKTPSRSKIRVHVRSNTEPSTNGQDKPLLLKHVRTKLIEVPIPSGESVKMLPQQLQLLQQQLRQHVQLSAGSFLQLYVHPMHWKTAPVYKEFLVTLEKLTLNKPDSVAAVCNLAPALELVRTWETTLSEDTPQNMEMVRFLQQEIDESRRRAAHHNLYAGEFHPTFKKVVAHSPVFLYPHLLPPMPFRTDLGRKNGYVPSEDELIALGLDQFWQFVEDNTALYPRRRTHCRRRWGYSAALELMCKVMFPWIPVRSMNCHITFVKKQANPDNPIIKFLRHRSITPVRHSLLPFDPHPSLLQQPPAELPPVWLKYRAETCPTAKEYLTQKSSKLIKPVGVDVDLGQEVIAPKKVPLPLDFTKKIQCNRPSKHDNIPLAETSSYPKILPTANPTHNLYSLVETSTGAYLMPLVVLPTTVNSNTTPSSVILSNNLPEDGIRVEKEHHCECCVLIRKMCKRQTSIEDYFKPKTKAKCPCKSVVSKKISSKLKALVRNYHRSSYNSVWSDLNNTISGLKGYSEGDCERIDLEDTVAATAFQLKLTSRILNNDLKRSVCTLFSRFDPESDNPVWLAKELKRVLQKDLIDLYKEFAAFLTAEQADILGVFKEYFVQNCLSDIVESVKKDIPDKGERLSFLSTISNSLASLSNVDSPCQLCAGLLRRARPGLARTLFNMFPHSDTHRTGENLEITRPSQPQQETEANTKSQVDPPLNTPATRRDATENNKADHSTNEDKCSDDDESETEMIADKMRRKKRQTSEKQAVKIESPSQLQENNASLSQADNTCQSQVVDTSNIKTEDSDSESSMSMMIMSDDETDPKWTKEEDKHILELVKKSLSSKEMLGISVQEILVQTDIFASLTQYLTHRSRTEIEDRVSYLLDMVVCSGPAE